MHDEYTIVVVVDRDEDAQVGVILSRKYQLWNSGDIETDADDHYSLFHSEHVHQVGGLTQALEYIADKNGVPADIIGGIAY